MLKIKKTELENGEVVLKIEGKIFGNYKEEFISACEEALKNGDLVSMDLSDVTFIDKEGGAYLKSLGRKKVQLVNKSLFIRDLLNR